jgi:hypothetical protein
MASFQKLNSAEETILKTSNDPQSIKPVKFRNREGAEAQVCRAIASLGKLAGIDVDEGNGPADIDAALIGAAYESNFDDPHFLGGPCCFNYARTVHDVDNLMRKAEPVVSGLSRYISEHMDQETVQKAATEIAIVDAAFAWLRKTVRSP